VTFRSSGPDNLFWKSADGSGEPERLTTSERAQAPTSWSPDGKALAFLERSLQQSAALNFDIWILARENGSARARPFVETPFNEQYAEFSPDGRWLVYSSNESGRDEVYVQPYPGPGGKQQVSVEGGFAPAWARNGRELFYTVAEPGGSTKMMAVDVTMGATFTAGAPRVLFEGQYTNTIAGRGYDVTPDGRRFLMVQVNQDQPRPAPPTTMILVQHWVEELKRLVPTN
jgi:Tol biopolymer transport system component